MQTAKPALSNRLRNGSLALIGALIALSSHAQSTTSTQQGAEKKVTVDHDHKHQLPTDVAIPHRVETAPTAPHPDEAKRLQQRAASLPQK